MGCGRGGEIPGWLSFESLRKQTAHHATAEVSLYVAENRRRKGIAKRIVANEGHISRPGGRSQDSQAAGASAHNGASLRFFEDFRFERWAHVAKMAELDGIERTTSSSA